MEQYSLIWLIVMFFIGSGVTLICVFTDLKFQSPKKEKNNDLKLSEDHIRKLKKNIDYRFQYQFGSSLAIVLIITLANLWGLFSKALGESFSLESNPFILLAPSMALLIVACAIIFKVMEDIDRVSRYNETEKS